MKKGIFLASLAVALGCVLIQGCSGERMATREPEEKARLEIEGVEFSKDQFGAAQKTIDSVRAQIEKGESRRPWMRIKISGENQILIEDAEVSEEQLKALVVAIAGIESETVTGFYYDDTANLSFVGEVVGFCSDSGLSTMSISNIRTEKIVKKK